MDTFSRQWLMPVAVVLAATILAFTFRTEYLMGGGLIKHDRLTGTLTACKSAGNRIICE